MVGVTTVLLAVVCASQIRVFLALVARIVPLNCRAVFGVGNYTPKLAMSIQLFFAGIQNQYACVTLDIRRMERTVMKSILAWRIIVVAVIKMLFVRKRHQGEISVLVWLDGLVMGHIVHQSITVLSPQVLTATETPNAHPLV